jgi:hypothetical protein
MGLHIYAGSLFRFFTNDWDNEIKQWSRENGAEYEAIYLDSRPEQPTKEAISAHIDWMKGILAQSIGIAGSNGVWNDDIKEYMTYKLHDEGREALTIVSAHLCRPDLTMPDKMPVDLLEDQALSEAGEGGYLLDAIAPIESSLLIPGDFTKVLRIVDPLGDGRLICSTGRLRTVLERLKSQYWNGVVQPSAWLERGLVYARGASTVRMVGDKWVETREAEPTDSLRGNAEFAFSVYSEILAFSQRHGAPIVTSW